MRTPPLDLSQIINSPSFWLAAAADAIAKEDSAKLQRSQEELHALGYLLLTPDQVEALGQLDDDQAEAEAQESKP